jgi:cation diffusion facilitator CzcD-associated flavoprotein CzcO
MIVDVKGQERTIVSTNIVLCNGPGGTIPLKPKIPGENSFKGVVLHSQQFKSAKEWSGKRGIVIGTGTSARSIPKSSTSMAHSQHGSRRRRGHAAAWLAYDHDPAQPYLCVRANLPLDCTYGSADVIPCAPSLP